MKFAWEFVWLWGLTRDPLSLTGVRTRTSRVVYIIFCHFDNYSRVYLYCFKQKSKSGQLFGFIHAPHRATKDYLYLETANWTRGRGRGPRGPRRGAAPGAAVAWKVWIKMDISIRIFGVRGSGPRAGADETQEAGNPTPQAHAHDPKTLKTGPWA